MSRHPLALALFLVSLTATIARADDVTLTTTVNGVDMALFIPTEAKQARGIIVHAANHKLKPNDRWAELCRELCFVHVVMNLPNIQKATNRPAKLHTALHEALKEFAAKSKQPELESAPLVGIGHSAGGLVVPVLLRTPNRMLTVCVDCGWVQDPEKWSADASGVPALFTMGAVPDAFKMLPSIEQHFEPARKKGLPWGLGVQWGCAHNFGNSATLMLPWIRAVAKLRLPAADGGKLFPAEVEKGWLGDRKSIDGHFATVAAWSDYKGDRTAAAWFPDREVAYVWRAWQTKDAPVTLDVSTADGKVRLPAWSPLASRDIFADPGIDVAVSVKVRDGTDVRRVQFYDGDRLIGEGKSAPWVFSWKEPASGTHAVWAQYSEAGGKAGATNPALVIVRSKKGIQGDSK